MDDSCIAWFRAIQKIMNTIDAQNNEINKLRAEKEESLKGKKVTKPNAK